MLLRNGGKLRAVCHLLLLVSGFVYSSALDIGAIRSSETSDVSELHGITTQKTVSA
jgi:hypothetical protein